MNAQLQVFDKGDGRPGFKALTKGSRDAISRLEEGKRHCGFRVQMNASGVATSIELEVHPWCGLSLALYPLLTLNYLRYVFRNFR